jgi:acylphosphatase/signal transduction histidine kinase
MIRAELIVEGEVQRVGYRDFVQSVARSLGVKGYIENLKDGKVRIVCEADEEILKNFIKEIEVKREFINVTKIKIVKTSPATGEFEYFEIRYGPLEEELGERMGTAIRYAGAMWQDIRDMHKDLKDETTAIRESIRDMHKDLKDETTAIRESIRDMHKDLKDETTAIRESIRDMHKDLKDETTAIRESIRDMHKDLKDETTAIRESIRDMHKDLKDETTAIRESIRDMHKDLKDETTQGEYQGYA